MNSSDLTAELILDGFFTSIQLQTIYLFEYWTQRCIMGMDNDFKLHMVIARGEKVCSDLPLKGTK